MRHKAILELYPDCIGITDGVGAFDKDQNLISLDETLIQKKISELEAEYEKQAYARSRAESYDPIPEQLDQIYHDIEGWTARIKAGKDKFPKPQ